MSSAEKPLVSVVTPVFNEGDYLGECIESVLAQTYPRWSYTIVDNASTDSTFDVATSYAARDSRIAVLRNETTVPVVENHNIAFRQVSVDAKYCKLVGADDWLYPDCLERMVSVAEANPSVALVRAYGRVGRGVDPGGFPFTKDVIPGKELCRTYLSRPVNLLGAATQMMFRADVVRAKEKFYSEDKLHSDLEACLMILQEHDYAFVHHILTFMRVRESSQTSLANEFNWYAPNLLEFLIRFGPGCFSSEELEQLVRAQVDSYFHYLAGQLLARRKQEFWDYHRDRLSELGYSLRKAQLVPTAILSMIGSVVMSTSIGSIRRYHRLTARPFRRP